MTGPRGFLLDCKFLHRRDSLESWPLIEGAKSFDNTNPREHFSFDIDLQLLKIQQFCFGVFQTLLNVHKNYYAQYI